jgi:hypothetical protein
MRIKEYSEVPRKFHRLVVSLYEDEGDISKFDGVSEAIHKRSGRRTLSHRDVLHALMDTYIETKGLEK